MVHFWTHTVCCYKQHADDTDVKYASQLSFKPVLKAQNARSEALCCLLSVQWKTH